MSANPFSLREKVEGKFTVENHYSIIFVFNNEGKWLEVSDLKWIESYYESYLSLDEIYFQITESLNNPKLLIRVIYETELWGVVFEIGQYDKKEWIVHGITKGFC